MTPEEKAVLHAAESFAVHGGQARELKLRTAVEQMRLARRPEHTVAPVPCGSVSHGGTMKCELRRGHDPEAMSRRSHQGRAADGSRRNWWEYLR